MYDLANVDHLTELSYVSSPDPASIPLPTYWRHEEYSFADGNVSFLVRKILVKLKRFTHTFTPSKVEDVLFTVHRYFFKRDSSVFADMFTLEPSPGATPEGTVENPIRLPDLRCIDFERFLSILYPPCVLPRPV